MNLLRAMKFSVVEGALATVMGTLVSGVFLTGFALTMGASQLQVGILATLPVLANLAQIAGAYFIERGDERKRLCVATLTLGRLLWLPVLLVPLLLSTERDGSAVWWMVAAIALSSVLSAVGGVAWLSWIKDLVPDNQRVGFFGRRNLLNTALSLVGGMLSALYLDWTRVDRPDALIGFIVVFAVAMMCGLAGLPILNAIPAPERPPSHDESFMKLLASPLKETNFRRLVMFYACWNLAVHIAQPFFIVYMLENLGMSFGYVTALATLSSVIGLAANNFWTQLSERFGTKPIIAIATLGDALFPLWWLFVAPESSWLLILIHCSGIFNAPLVMGPNNLVLKLAPERNSSPYLAVFNAVVGPMTAVASIGGGLLAASFASATWSLGPIEMGSLKTVFLLSFVGRLVSLVLLRGVHEPASEPVIHVFHELRRRAVLRKQLPATTTAEAWTASDRKAA